MPREIQSIPVTFANSGIVLKSAADEIPLTAYMALVNVYTDRENSLSVRKGFTRLNDGLPGTPYSAFFLRDINGRQWRYAITGQRMFVAPVTDPGDNSIWPTALGTDFGAVSGGSGLSSAVDPRPIWASYTLIGREYKPHVFMADGTKFLKHRAGDGYTDSVGAARRVGIPKPFPFEAVEISDNATTEIEAFNDKSLFTTDNVTVTDETGHDAGIGMGIALPASDAQAGGAYKAMLSGGYPVLVDLDPTDPDGIIEIWIKFEDEESALNCAEIVLAFGLSATPGDVTFDTRYEKAIKPSAFEGASQVGSTGRTDTYQDAVPDANTDLANANTSENFTENNPYGPYNPLE